MAAKAINIHNHHFFLFSLLFVGGRCTQWRVSRDRAWNGPCARRPWRYHDENMQFALVAALFFYEFVIIESWAHYRRKNGRLLKPITRIGNLKKGNVLSLLTAKPTLCPPRIQGIRLFLYN